MISNRSIPRNFPVLLNVVIMLVLLIGSTLIVTPVRADSTITVNTIADEDDTGTDCSLREAITAANTNAAYGGCTAGTGADTITLPAGTYTLTILGAGDDVNLTGDLDITAALTINGAGAGTTIIRASAAPGSGIDRVFHVLGAISVSISNVAIANGNCPSCNGGGIFNDGTLTVTNSTLSGNSGGDYGGGIENNGTLTLNNSTISGNSATLGGGLDANSGTLTLNNSTVSGNSAGYAGGIETNSGTVVTLNNSTVSGNSAAGFGGGIASSATLALNYSTVANNTSDDDNTSTDGGGGGLYNGNTAVTTVKSSILAGNKIGTSGDGDCLPISALTSQGYNLTGAFTGCNLAATGDLTVDAADVFTTVLGPLAGNGGATQTHALLAGSPALDQIPNGTNSCGTVPFNLDQRGQARPFDTNCDIGSFELIPTPTTTTITYDGPDPSRVGQASAVEVTVTGGATPTGTVDITGADTNCTITLAGGTGSCNINFASPGPKTLTATYNGDDASNPSSDTEAHIAALVKSFRSSAAEDGWILESGENTNAGGTMNSASTTLRMGDAANDRQYRSIMSFNTASLPNTAVIASVLLQTTWVSSVGNPNFADFGGRSFVDLKNPTFGAASLELADFITSPTVIAGGYQTTPIGNLYRAYFSAGSFSSINLVGLTQVRIRFKLDDDNDNVADYFSFFSGNAAVAADRPLLQILYYVP